MISEDEASKLFAPYMAQFTDVFKGAFSEYNREHATQRHKYSASTQSAIIRDLILDHARRIFDGVPGVGFVTVQRMDVMHIGSDAVIRFKKFNRHKRSSNIPTRQSRRFLLQMSLSGLPPEATRFQIGYILNSLRTGFSELWITCPDGNKIRYSFALESPVRQLSIESTDHVPNREIGRRVKPKIEALREAHRNEGDSSEQ